jgi:hypothetical protein
MFLINVRRKQQFVRQWRRWETVKQKTPDVLHCADKRATAPASTNVVIDRDVLPLVKRAGSKR